MPLAPHFSPLTSGLPTATGRDPWANLRDNPPRPPVSAERLAFGTGNITRDPAYTKANLPPYLVR